MLKIGRVVFVCKSHIGFVIFEGNDRRIFRFNKYVEVEAFCKTPRLTRKQKIIEPEKLHKLVCRVNSRGDVEEWATLEDWRRIKKEIADQKEVRNGPSLAIMYTEALAQ